MGYWMVLLFALIKSLGKSEKVTSELQESNAGKASSMPPKRASGARSANLTLPTAGLCQPDTLRYDSEHYQAIHVVPYTRDLHQTCHKMVVSNSCTDSQCPSTIWVFTFIGRMLINSYIGGER